jgi:four helix bundle protein
MSKSILQDKSLLFAVRCVNMYRSIVEDKREYVLSKQMLRSSTSIGANITESRNAQSDADFISKLSIALKEADETAYWFELMKMTGFISEEEYVSVSNDLGELIAMLVTTLKKKKNKV